MKFKFYIVSILLLLATTVFGQSEFPERPNPPRLVNDLANVLNQAEEKALEQKLVHFFSQTSTQICVVTIKSLSGYDIASYTTQLGEKWGVGLKGSDNGILLLIKPKTATSDGQVFTAVGYGLEGVVPDATANRDIVNAELIPNFKRNDYFTGIDRATTVLIGLTKGEFTAQQYRKSVKKASGKSSGGGFWLLLLIFFVIIPAFSRRRRSYGLGHSLPFWAALTMLGSNSHRHSGYFNDFSSGGGGFGGGFGDSGGGSFGDFGGFGGGSFGGGGAGGSW
ncbi:TPM domain-containing protein [Puteibacter caeruleilacunae]|nr:TPM domain-containing protein [Puteibacter caeruleilacunae]